MSDQVASDGTHVPDSLSTPIEAPVHDEAPAADPATEPVPVEQDKPEPAKPGPVKVSAVYFPGTYKSALPSGHRKTLALQDEAKKLMAADPDAPVFLRNHGDHFFVTCCPHDCMYFPTWHERSGQARYKWTGRGDGVKVGVLVDGAAGMVGGVDPRDE